MISIRFVPIDKWPGETPRFTHASKFEATYSKTLDLLQRELRQLGARDVVMQAFFRPNQIRQDGFPYSGARPERSGVILSFRTASKGAFSFPCWRYSKFEDNVRAIALSLEALRAVDRYGVTQRAEQYQGWKQIEAPGARPVFESADSAARFVCVKATGEDPKPEELREMLMPGSKLRTFYYRKAAAKLHPDQPNGSHEEFVMLQQALAVLEADQAKGAGN